MKLANSLDLVDRGGNDGDSAYGVYWSKSPPLMINNNRPGDNGHQYSHSL